MNVRRKRRNPVRVPPDTNVCGLCKEPPDEKSFGHFFRDERAGLSVHQYCMFFASGLAQNGEDEDGFDGFLGADIRTEIARAAKLSCAKCRRKGASIGCCVSTCRRKYHYLCGKEQRALFQFFGNFKTYCHEHRPHQRVPVPSRFGSCKPLSVMCPICLCNVAPDSGINSLRTPCCKNTWFHRDCIQRQALSSGMYFFRCPVCNNKDKFQDEMNVMGIYIPDQDAIWEEGDAYADLLFSYNRCDATHCLCKKGRTFSTKTGHWRIRLCDRCGQFGTHAKCQHWRRIPDEWMCGVCAGSSSDGTSEAGSSSSSVSSHQDRQERVEESDVDVEICDDSDPDEVTQGQFEGDTDQNSTEISQESADACKEPAFAHWQNGPVECLENDNHSVGSTKSSCGLQTPCPLRHAFNQSTSSHLHTCMLGGNPITSNSKLSPNHADVPSKSLTGCHGNNSKYTSHRMEAPLRSVIYDICRAGSEALADAKAKERLTYKDLCRGSEDDSSCSAGRELPGFSEEITKHACVQTSSHVKGRKRKRLSTYFDFNMYL